MKKPKKTKKPKLLSGTKLTKALDSAIRDYFKLLYGINVTCFVTGRTLGWYHPKNNPNGCQVGHFISRRIHRLRWDLKNVYPQSAGSNKAHNQNPAPFANAIVSQHGKERLEYLDRVSRESRGTKVSTLEKREILADLLKKIESLQTARNVV
jgi:hypothetical protein